MLMVPQGSANILILLSSPTSASEASVESSLGLNLGVGMAATRKGRRRRVSWECIVGRLDDCRFEVEHKA